ncbi:GatB/YqeY domain-containing protein [Candidatus Parcubacteria bacterium]|jgi:uncharacterized protein YqeY|nr:MAG: GatB/YqeY domain-containing protein [Candidatus Parcubacteria bacterium]
MNLSEKIEADLVGALKNKETDKVEVLRFLKSVLHNAKIAKREDLTNAEVEKQIASEIKRRTEAITQFQAGGREDLAQKDTQALEILKKYLPEQLPEAEIEKIIREQIGAVNAQGPRDFGKVMGSVMAKVGTQADGKMVQVLVKKLLT